LISFLFPDNTNYQAESLNHNIAALKIILMITMVLTRTISMKKKPHSPLAVIQRILSAG